MYEHLDPHTAAVRQTVSEYLAPPSKITLWHTFAPHAIGRLTYEFWGRHHRGRRWFGFGGCLFWLFLGVGWALGMAMKLSVFTLAIVGVCLAQFAVWSIDLLNYPFRARQLEDERHDRLAARHAG